MEKLTLTYVGRFPKKSKEGKDYTSISVKCREYGDKYLSGFGNAWNEKWKDGDVVEVDVTKKPAIDKEGKATEYINFSKPDPTTELSKAVMRHERDIQELKKIVAGFQKNEEVPTVSFQGDTDEFGGGITEREGMELVHS